jgi:hypothetical protein
MGEYAFRCSLVAKGSTMGNRCEVLWKGRAVATLDTASNFVFGHGYPFVARHGTARRIALFRDVWNGVGMRVYLDFRKDSLVGTDSLPWFPTDPMEGVR